MRVSPKGTAPSGKLIHQADKEALYQTKQRAAALIAHGESLLDPMTAQAVHRLAWLEQVQITLAQLQTWLTIQERLRGSAFLFFGRPTFFRGLLGNGLGATLAGIIFNVSHVLGLILYFSCNGITLIIADHLLRRKVVRECNALAQKIGGWVGPQVRPREVGTMVEQVRARLGSWVCCSRRRRLCRLSLQGNGRGF